MTDPPAAVRARCLCLDIETARHDVRALREVGVYRPDRDLRCRLAGDDPALAARLNELTDGAAFVLGHNLIAFDQPALAALHPGLALHRLPLVDTLALSPIAFPQNPYHRLVKDYKLCTTARNDPVRDAELAYTLFLEQRAALVQRFADHPDQGLCLHFLLVPEDGGGAASFFATLRHALRPSLDAARAAWGRLTMDQVCAGAQRTVHDDWLPDPGWHAPLAYVLAWLTVAGHNSVLPPWVRRGFPKVREAIARLRDRPCNDSQCRWCRTRHDLDALLGRYFPGMTRFRAEPATPDGRSLQQTIVEHGMAGTPLLAILPTGGGKSLCFQLPALARFYRNGSLTVVVSPLVSLMKDQVDNLAARGITCAGYLNGLLTPLERQAMLDKLRLGDLGLIFVAPEQLRSRAFINALRHREVGGWVLDEAHCLSKWGHDFRPDYLYVSRFIREDSPDAPAPVWCFTATAKPEVVEDICTHFAERLGMTLTRLEGGVARHNLSYEVRKVPAAAKFAEVLRLVREALADEGGVIVFCARQRATEDLSAFLREAGLASGHFHGGLSAEEKREAQAAFLSGALRVMVATNAFGMGVDKPDVRLVVHLDTPGSLENYLQESGRAGRDQAPAHCVLLHDEADLDVQFRLLRNARLTQHEIGAILRALRVIGRRDRDAGEVVATSGEILLEIPEAQRLDPDSPGADTKVRIAVAWLEEARLLSRHENHTPVFPGSLRVRTLDEAEARLRRLLGPDADARPYLRLLSTLMQARDDEGVSTDELMRVTGRASAQVQHMLRELDRWQLLSNDTEIGVTLCTAPGTPERLDALHRLEDALVSRLREAAPDAAEEAQDDTHETGGWQVLDVRRLCDTLRRDTGQPLDPERLMRLLRAFAEPFGRAASERSFLAIRPHSVDTRRVRLLRGWREIDHIRARRMTLARTLAGFFLARRKGSQTLVTCKQGELEAALQQDVALAALAIERWDTALSAALLYLDANEVLHLSRGKAVFRPAMRIALNPDASRRQFSKSDYAGLALHYRDKIVQVHVMAEYARLAIDKIQAAAAFVVDYFRLPHERFVRRYFAGRRELLEMATSGAAFRDIVTALADPAQQAIVTAAPEGNHLVLAGPGAGKTRIIVHRVAWLLRVQMVPPHAVMVLAYNRAAALEIRRRLVRLVGDDARMVTVQTLHALALRLTGTSVALAVERGESVDFDDIIVRAARLLRAAEGVDEAAIDPNLPPEVSPRRDRLLAGLRFVLVDEYQDINGAHYALISALAGRTLASDADRVSLTVVGDDDQNIYAFDGASVRYIRAFETDFGARRHALLENYRSTRAIIDAANRLIDAAPQRMKQGQPIRINHARRDDPDGGPLGAIDAFTQGRVLVLNVPPDPRQEAQLALAELRRRHALLRDANTPGWGGFAVIARHWHALLPLAALCRRHGLPVRMLRDAQDIGLHATREGDALLGLLRGRHRSARIRRVLVRAGALARWFRRRYGQPVDAPVTHAVQAALARFIRNTTEALPDARLLADDLIEALYDAGNLDAPGSHDRNDAATPLLLTSAHRAKGLEFDHVLILDADGWRSAGAEERRLYYVAMTRARQSLVLCETTARTHALVPALEGSVLRVRPEPGPPEPNAELALWRADPSLVVLSWPARFVPDSPVHRAIAALDIGSALLLRPRNGHGGWELANADGQTVSRLSSRFQPPAGDIVAVRVAAILVRHDSPRENPPARCPQWEVVLPEIEYRPARTG